MNNKTTLGKKLALLLLGSVLSQAGMAATLFDNGGPDLLNAFASDFNQPPNGLQQADDFSLSQDSMVQDFHWFGLYADLMVGPPGVPLNDDFTLRIFDDQDMNGAPDANFLFEFRQGTTAQVTRTLISTNPPDETVFGYLLYRYDAVIVDTPLPAGGYFLSMVNATQDLVSNESWFWATSDAVAGRSWQRPGEPPSANSWGSALLGDFAFSITGIPVTGIPEPTSVVLMLAGVAGITRIRRKR